MSASFKPQVPAALTAAQWANVVLYQPAMATHFHFLRYVLVEKRFFGPTLVSGTVFDQYVGRRYLFSNNIGAPIKQTITPYNLLNLVISAKIPINTGSYGGLRMLKVWFNVYNLLNRQYNSTAYISAGGYFSGVNSAGAVLANPGMPRAFFVQPTASFL